MKWYEEPRICKDCGEEFKAHQYNQYTCIFCLSKTDSRFSYKKLMKECKGCGDSFVRKECKGCGDSFVRNSPTQNFCNKKCQETNGYLLRTYKITRKDYIVMFDNQDGLCRICNSKGFVMDTTRHKDALVVDHCHSTGKVRGLLCHNCNRALGLLNDSTENILRALDYLYTN